MPEGHTLHRLATALDQTFGGEVVRTTSPQGRFAESAALLDGAVLERAEAYGKHLFVHFEAEQVVHVHLGLYGRFDVHRSVDPDGGGVLDPRGQVRWRIVRGDGAAYADLRGATACELLVPEQVEVVLARQGPDPLRPGTDPTPAWDRIRRSRAPIGGLLMDQSVLAGVGNVYRAEILFRHKVDPFRPGRTLRVGQWQAMWDDLVELMGDGVRAGRIETVRPEDAEAARVRGGLARRRGARNYVYKRTGEPCLVCGAAVRTEEMQARNLYWCPRCQRRFRSRAVG